MFDVMNVMEDAGSMGDFPRVELWDDGDVTFYSGERDFDGEISYNVDLEVLENFVARARAWIRAREALKDKGTQP